MPQDVKAILQSLLDLLKKKSELEWKPKFAELDKTISTASDFALL